MSGGKPGEYFMKVPTSRETRPPGISEILTHARKIVLLEEQKIKDGIT